MHIERKKFKYLLLALLKGEKETVIYLPFCSSICPSTVSEYKQGYVSMPSVQTIMCHSLVHYFPMVELSLFLELHEAVITSNNQIFPSTRR